MILYHFNYLVKHHQSFFKDDPHIPSLCLQSFMMILQDGISAVYSLLQFGWDVSQPVPSFHGPSAVWSSAIMILQMVTLSLVLCGAVFWPWLQTKKTQRGWCAHSVAELRSALAGWGSNKQESRGRWRVLVSPWKTWAGEKSPGDPVEGPLGSGHSQRSHSKAGARSYAYGVWYL